MTDTERLVAIQATLLFALPIGESVEAFHDIANLALIPIQRREGEAESQFIDYTFNGEPIEVPGSVVNYDYDNGFTLTPLAPLPDPLPPPAVGGASGLIDRAVAELLKVKLHNDALQETVGVDSPTWHVCESIDDHIHEALVALGQ